MFQRDSAFRTWSQACRNSPATWACICLVTWTVEAALLWPVHASLLNWDEVDYVNAARLGIVANALEKGSLSPSEFVQFGLSKMRSTGVVLPERYIEGRDPFVLRHGHPPFVVFLLSLVAHVQSERGIRSVQLFGSLIFTCAVVLSYVAVTRTVQWPGLLLVSVLALWMTRLAFGSVSFHGWEATWATVTAALLASLSGPVAVSGRVLGIGLSMVLALSALTLETGLVLWVGTMAWLAVWRWSEARVGGPRAGGTKVALRDLAMWFCLAGSLVLVIWPASISGISVLKTFATRAYTAHLGQEYATVSYMTLARDLLPALVLGGIGLGWLVVTGAGCIRQWGPFALIGCLYGLAMGPFAVQSHYLVPAAAPLVCLAGLACDRIPAGARIALLAVACVAVAVAWPAGSISLRDRESREDLQWLSEALRAQEALVDGGHIYRYYLGPHYGIQSVEVGSQGDVLLLRERGTYRKLRSEDILGRLVVIQATRPDTLLGGVQGPILRDCSRMDRFTVRVYDCRVAGTLERHDADRGGPDVSATVRLGGK